MLRTGMLFFLCMGILLPAGNATGASDPYDYISMYNIIPQMTYFYSQKDQTGFNCQKNPYIGTSSEYSGFPYQCELLLRGFREMADFNDPRVCESKDLATAGYVCSLDKADIYLQIPREYGALWGKAGSLSQMRFFVPPGTTRLGFLIHIPQSQDIAFAFRYGQPPECTSCNADYNKLPVTCTSNARLDTLSQKDVYMINGGGSVQLSMGFKQCLSEDEAGWLYVKVLPYSSDQINTIIAHVEVDLSKFMAWFNSYTNWDESGDPLPLLGSPGNNQCTGASLSECSNSYACVAAGGVWCAGACRPSSACRVCCGNQCFAQTDCQYCCDGTCCAEPCEEPEPAAATGGCSASNLGECTNAYNCQSYGGVWCARYESCYSPGDAPSDCETPTQTPINLSNCPMLTDCDNSEIDCFDSEHPHPNIVKREFSGDDKLNISFFAPAYADSVKLAAAILRPDSNWAIFGKDGNNKTSVSLLTDANMTFLLEQLTEPTEIQLIDTPVTVQGLGEKIRVLDQGEYTLFWLVLPTDKDISLINVESDPYELYWMNFTVR